MPEEGMLTFVSMGAILGLSAGISPGPLLTLVISETIKHSRREGIKIALTPLISDFPIIVFSLIVLSMFANSRVALSVMAFLGGIFVAYLGLDCLKSRGLALDTQKSEIKSLNKGTIVNILNPHPYLFWITVGAPVVLKAWHLGVGEVIAFLIPFYVFLVGSKITVAFLVDKSKSFMNNRSYIWIMRILGLSLLFFALLFFYDGINILKEGLNRSIHP